MKVCKNLIKKAKMVALFSHENPDPDTIGSTIALYNALTQMGKHVELFCESEISENYNFLSETKQYNSQDFNPQHFDLLIAVDIAASHMLGRFEDAFLSHANTLRFDHHTNGDNFAKANFVQKSSACAILVYKLLEYVKFKINEPVATSLFLGICGDTGLFRNNGTDSESFEVAGKLINLGANIRKVYDEFFDKKTVSAVKMTATSLLSAELDEKYKFAVLTSKAEDYQKFNVPENDNLGNLPLTYLSCGYKIAVILKEKSDGIHCSFRSKAEFDVSALASEFGGGGHKNAAGCRINSSLSEAKKQVKKAITNYLKTKEEQNVN